MVICFFSTQYLPTPAGSSGIPGIWGGGVWRQGIAPLSSPRRCRACPRGSVMPTASKSTVCPSWPVMGGRFPVLKPFADADDLWAQGIDFAVIQTRMYMQSVWAARQCKRRGIPALVIDHSTGYMLHGGLAGALGKAYEHAGLRRIRRCGFPFYGCPPGCRRC